MSKTENTTKYTAIKGTDFKQTSTTNGAYIIANEAGDVLAVVQKRGTRFYAETADGTVKGLPGQPSLTKAVIALDANVGGLMPATVETPAKPAKAKAKKSSKPAEGNDIEQVLEVVKSSGATTPEADPKDGFTDTIRVGGRLPELMAVTAKSDAEKAILAKINDTAERGDGTRRVVMHTDEMAVVRVMAEAVLATEGNLDRGAKLAASMLIKRVDKRLVKVPA